LKTETRGFGRSQSLEAWIRLSVKMSTLPAGQLYVSIESCMLPSQPEPPMFGV
jgi:hypothetical protein